MHENGAKKHYRFRIYWFNVRWIFSFFIFLMCSLVQFHKFIQDNNHRMMIKRSNLLNAKRSSILLSTFDKPN